MPTLPVGSVATVYPVDLIVPFTVRVLFAPEVDEPITTLVVEPLAPLVPMFIAFVFPLAVALLPIPYVTDAVDAPNIVAVVDAPKPLTVVDPVLDSIFPTWLISFVFSKLIEPAIPPVYAV